MIIITIIARSMTTSIGCSMSIVPGIFTGIIEVVEYVANVMVSTVIGLL